eukprot:TRINITY_DN35473_c0_g1_i1.p1 TRINITY_DN35473_c0_g1~~TRINITY_DN35473_c0_g1_i1.p1  ORF type:complete len:179 (-),score=29.34 TRINITY_DN35473_c0_g1_i1:732-1268(-)
MYAFGGGPMSTSGAASARGKAKKRQAEFSDTKPEWLDDFAETQAIRHLEQLRQELQPINANLHQVCQAVAQQGAQIAKLAEKQATTTQAELDTLKANQLDFQKQLNEINSSPTTVPVRRSGETHRFMNSMASLHLLPHHRQMELLTSLTLIDSWLGSGLHSMPADAAVEQVKKDALLL